MKEKDILLQHSHSTENVFKKEGKERKWGMCYSNLPQSHFVILVIGSHSHARKNEGMETNGYVSQIHLK